MTLIALVLLPVMGFAQDKHLYSHETGRFDLVADMGGMTMTSKFTFADFGATRRVEMEVMGQKVVMVEKGGKRYLVSPSFREMPADEAVVNYNDLTPEVIEKYSIKQLDDEQIGDYKCTVYTFKKKDQGVDADCKIWIWKGFPIKSENSAMGITVETLIQNLEVDVPVDRSLFELPQ